MLRRQGTIASEISLEDRKDEKVEEEEEEEESEGRGYSSAGQYAGNICDWSETAVCDVHMFVASTTGVETCYLGPDCPLPTTTGERLKCVSCRVVTHSACRPAVQERLRCKVTFQSGVRTYRDVPGPEHHWVARRVIKGKCRHCGKTFQSKLGTMVASTITGVSCSWCNISYHTTAQCQDSLKLDIVCGLGVHSGLIVPPAWILKLPRKGKVKSSISGVAAANKKTEASEDFCSFILKPFPISNCSPLIVFLNPKSGGNQGAKLMQRFQSLLNPRQVFDLTRGGPRPAIEMFGQVPEVRLLACGGDGTAGWVLSVLDKVSLTHPPPVGVLPLGTGNDLSRSLGWGGGYMDEPLGDILLAIQSADIISLDRWRLETIPDPDSPRSGKGVDFPPLDVVNNYFSLGVDAQIALQFHEAREANPEKFNSRVRNKMYYTQAGGVDLLKAKWRKLSEMLSVECDGVDITPKLRQLKVHSVLFLNISCFGSGTRPWDSSKGSQKLDDGLIEVVGLTTYQLPLLQAGGTGHCITQCRTAKIVTTRTIPVQVDGEAVRLNPATIKLGHLNKAKILAKKKSGRKIYTNETEDMIGSVAVKMISRPDYLEAEGEKETVQSRSLTVGSLELDRSSDLRHTRTRLNKLNDDIQNGNREKSVNIGNNWQFIDMITARNCFRIERKDETKYFLIDICQKELFIINNDQQNDNDLDYSTMKTGRTRQTRKPSYHIPIPVYKATNGLLEKNSEALLRAARLGDIVMLTEMYQDGFSLLAIDETAKTALHYGARFGHKEIIKFLLAKAPHCIVDIVDNEKGQTALHKAAAYDRQDICCLLVTAGASLLVEDCEGRRPRNLAETGQAHPDLISYLKSQEHFQTIAQQDVETPI